MKILILLINLLYFRIIIGQGTVTKPGVNLQKELVVNINTTQRFTTVIDVLIGESLRVRPVLSPDALAEIDFKNNQFTYYVEKDGKLFGSVAKVMQLTELYPPLNFVNCTQLTSGEYSLVLRGLKNFKKISKFHIGVKSKPIMEFLNVAPLNPNKLKDKWTITVRIYLHPNGEINWWFRPCGNLLRLHKTNICKNDKYKIDNKLITTKSKEYIVNTTVVFQPKRSGIITCNCINILGDTEITENILLEDAAELEQQQNITLIGTDLGSIFTNTESDFLNVYIDENYKKVLFNVTAKNFVTIHPVLDASYRKYLLSKYSNMTYYWVRNNKIVSNISYSDNLSPLWPPYYPKTDIFDSAVYSFVLKDLENKFERIVNVEIAIKSEPLIEFIELEPLNAIELNENWTATVKVYLYPMGKINWYFTPCYNLNIGSYPKCHKGDRYEIQPTAIAYNSSLHLVNVTINFKPMQSGNLTCTVTNELGNQSITKFILLNDETDLTDRINIRTVPDGGVAFVEDTISIKCTCHSFYNYLDLYSVEKDTLFKCYRLQSSNKHGIKLSRKWSILKRTVTAKITNIQLTDTGLYECRCYKDLKNLIYDTASLQLNVKEKERNVWLTDFIYITIGIVLLLITSIGSYIFYQKKIKEKPWTLLYDKKYEFPINRIKIESELGSGAFGVVFEAIAEGILPNEAETTVAVKTVKKSSANESTLRALESELEILLTLGKHLNIINLLGSVTKSNQRYRLMVIVEFCKYGNLKSYIFENKISFNNNMNMENGIINNFYNVNELSTNTLIYWSYQIAKGMEYVASVNILHGDLAARNILLCDHDIVKICDFGLAKSINYHYNYQTKNDTPLPVRWLAIETLECGILSTYSDIWSYGIFIWELFSLCNDPYRKFPVDRHVFLEKLMGGYRLDKPKFANNEIYQIMMECWKEQPKERPSFSNLVQRFENILAAEALENYLNHTKRFQEQVELRNLEREPTAPNQYSSHINQGMELLPIGNEEKKINKKYYNLKNDSSEC